MTLNKKAALIALFSCALTAMAGNPMDDLKNLVGTFEGAYQLVNTDGSDGPTVNVVQTYTWGEDKKFLTGETTATIDGKVVMKVHGMITWNEAEKHWHFMDTTLQDQTMIGTIKKTGKKHFKYEWTQYSGRGEYKFVQKTTWDDKDTLRFLAEVVIDGKPVTVMKEAVLNRK